MLTVLVVGRLPIWKGIWPSHATESYYSSRRNHMKDDAPYNTIWFEKAPKLGLPLPEVPVELVGGYQWGISSEVSLGLPGSLFQWPQSANPT